MPLLPFTIPRRHILLPFPLQSPKMQCNHFLYHSHQNSDIISFHHPRQRSAIISFTIPTKIVPVFPFIIPIKTLIAFYFIIPKKTVTFFPYSFPPKQCQYCFYYSLQNSSIIPSNHATVTMVTWFISSWYGLHFWFLLLCCT